MGRQYTNLAFTGAPFPAIFIAILAAIFSAEVQPSVLTDIIRYKIMYSQKKSSMLGINPSHARPLA
jgi:hypothetical protein